MLSKILWGVSIGSLIALVWIGYRRGSFDDAGQRMRYGVDRVKEGLQVAGNKARESLHTVRNRAEEGMEVLGDVAREKATQVQGRVKHGA